MSTDTNAVPTVNKITEADAVKAKKNATLARDVYTDGSNRLTCLLRKVTDKNGAASYKTSVQYRLGRKTTVGCKASFTDESAARRAQDANKAKASAIGWKPVVKPVKNMVGAFTLDNFPIIGQKAAELPKKGTAKK